MRKKPADFLKPANGAARKGGGDGEVARIARAYEQYRENERHVRWSLNNLGNRLILEERTEFLRRGLERSGFLPLAGLEVLDIGCGRGDLLAELKQWNAQDANLHGVDLLAARVKEATRGHPELDIRQMNAADLAFPNECFDLVFLYTVFTSLLDHRMSARVASEAVRVLRPGGAIVWYDFRYSNPRNPNVRGVSARRIRALFPTLSVELETLTVLPPLARRLGGTATVLYPVLRMFPLLRTHYFGILHKE